MTRLLAIETSCDDTCAAVVEDNRILSNVISSQASFHEAFGGIVPEIASRQHIELINGVVAAALGQAGVDLDDLEMIERYGRDVDTTLPANWSTDESYLRWAIGNAAWCLAEEGHPYEVTMVLDVDELLLPEPFLSMSELCDEIAGPTWESIEGAS
jgi:hypothetical protein